MAQNRRSAAAAIAGIAIVMCSGDIAAAETAVTDVSSSTPGVIAAFITAGAVDPAGKVPVLNAVKGAGVSNITMASPLAVLKHGNAYALILTSQNVAFMGTCTDSYVLQRGSKILAHGTIHRYACAPATYWEWEIISPAIPNSPGPATLVGTVTFGGKTTTATANVFIE